MDNFKLTQYSHGAGCGCKIAPSVLEEILMHESSAKLDKWKYELLVGNETKDDAAVCDIGGGRAIISTTDFFMPVVDDAYNFGRVAAVNAISDIYAMGGTPLMAVSILGWPLNILPASVAGRVVDGGRDACMEANIPLAGGHSIDSPEPIFGLAVTGIIEKKFLKRNSTAKAGCKLYLTKPIGVGILTTAQKKELLKPEHKNIALDQMLQLNKIGAAVSSIKSVTAMTDVTGFGLLGHLLEMCEGSGVNAALNYSAVPKIEAVETYIELQCIPGGTNRNWNSYGHKISGVKDKNKILLCDPQTSGGLLIAVLPEGENQLLDLFAEYELHLNPIGRLLSRKEEGPYIAVQ